MTNTETDKRKHQMMINASNNYASPSLPGELKKHLKGRNYVTIDNFLTKERKIRKMIVKVVSIGLGPGVA